MRVLLINSVCGIGSTGRICTDLAEQFEKEGHKVKIAYGRDAYVPENYQKYTVRIGSDLDVKLHGIRTRLLDEHGFGSKRATKKFLQWAEEYDPDLVWLHNIHGYYINVECLFQWIKSRPNMQVKWTLHDCWAFTGHCAYFTMAKCEQWIVGCTECPQKKKYPTSDFKDNCRRNFERKRKCFTGVSNMTLITPSKWLADLVKKSFLREYPVEIHYNTIDTSIFKPTQSDFRKKYKIEDKKVILGVASVWDERKGLEDFYKLAGMLDQSYTIVLVGLSENQISDLPTQISGLYRTNSLDEPVAVFTMSDICQDDISENGNIVCKEIVNTKDGVAVPQGVENLYWAILNICEGQTSLLKPVGVSMIIAMSRTNHASELAELYTIADVFVNPTYEDNYPTVNLEARACGTRVVTYDTGGCVETLQQEYKAI